jgi:heat shock protein HslJ
MTPLKLSLILLVSFFGLACQPKPDAALTEAESKEQTMTSKEIPTPSAWRIVSCERDGKTMVAVNDRGFVAIRDGQIGGNTGCNTFGGEWTGSPAKMKVGGVMATKMFCADSNEQESMVLATLNGTVTSKLQGKLLTLSGGGTTIALQRDDSLLK